MRPLVECVPNFSEARRPEVVHAIVQTIEATPGVRVLDVHSDADHNRSVVTFVGAPAAAEAAAFAGIAEAAQRIDLRQHRGEHPRIGATDVVPFVPLRDVTLEDCADLARRLGERVGRELQLPVYLYGAAATRPARERLENIRRGQYERLAEEIATREDRRPDFGPTRLGPAGAVAIGARRALVAFNVYLDTDDVEVARRVARAVRESGGGLPHVKALGLKVHGRAQVSMNLTDTTITPITLVMEHVRQAAAGHGAGIARSELVGLIPESAVLDAARQTLGLEALTADQVLENRLPAGDA